MLSGELNENGKKTTIGLIIKQATLHVQHTFSLYISLPFFLHGVRLQREISRNFLVFKDGNKLEAFKSQTENFTF